MGKRKAVWKFLTVLQEEKEAKWLGEMSSQGWHLIHYAPFRYLFEKGDPKNYIYKFDFRWRIEDWDHYLSLYEEAGWEYILTFAAWRYFRCDPDNVRVPEIFTDLESRVDKYTKLMRFLGLVFIYLIVVSITIVFNPHNDHSYGLGLKWLYGILLGIYTYILAGLYLRIREIKSKR